MKRLDGISSSQKTIDLLKSEIRVLKAHECKPCKREHASQFKGLELTSYGLKEQRQVLHLPPDARGVVL